MDACVRIVIMFGLTNNLFKTNFQIPKSVLNPFCLKSLVSFRWFFAKFLKISFLEIKINVLGPYCMDHTCITTGYHPKELEWRSQFHTKWAFIKQASYYIFPTHTISKQPTIFDHQFVFNVNPYFVADIPLFFCIKVCMLPSLSPFCFNVTNF